MARKSRRKYKLGEDYESKKAEAIQVKDELIKKPTVLATAAYIRLSLENNGHETDDSIKTQIALVESYIKDNKDLILTETFVDNGYSGTNFDRPEFERMMEEVKCGRIQCIVVKDLSRFGRDYLETGYYLENIFPLLNVRFIAITDQYDSTRQCDRESISVPIKNMVNDMYAKDFSRKQDSFREMARKTGRVMGNYAPYGYAFSKEKKKLEINDYVAPFVRMIFAWALSGVSRIEIAKRMNTLGAQTPGEYETNTPAQRKWKDSTIKAIVYNPTYAGFHVMGRSYSSKYKGIGSTEIDRDKWLYFPNYHEPYITLDEYNQIEDLIKESKNEREEQLKVREKVRQERKDLFKGKIFCADCGRQMNFVRGCHHRGYNDISFQYYRCRYSKKYPECNNRKFQENFLKIMVMDQIKVLSEVALDKEKLIHELQSKYETNGSITYLERNISRLAEKEEVLSNKILQAYSDFVDNLLTDEEYATIKSKLISEKKGTVEKREEVEQKIIMTKRSLERFCDVSERIRKYVDETECTDKLIEELIDRIVITNENKIEITFSCGDVFNDPLVEEYISGTSEQGR